MAVKIIPPKTIGALVSLLTVYPDDTEVNIIENEGPVKPTFIVNLPAHQGVELMDSLIVIRETVPHCEIEHLIDSETGSAFKHCEMQGFWALKDDQGICNLHTCHAHLTPAINRLIEV